MNQIITITELTNASNRKFKDPRLADATKRISAIYTDAAKFVDTKNREIASILANVMDEKAYEKDGFKSVGDYAKEVFGINRQNAYSLATAGKVYNDDNAPAALKAMTPSKLAEVAKVPADALNKAIEEGKITADTTQKDLREFASAATGKKEKPEVLDTYTARPCSTATTEREADDYKLPRTIADWDEYFMERMTALNPSRAPECINLSKVTPLSSPGAKKATVPRRLYVSDNYCMVVEFAKFNPSIPAKPKYTKEQLLAMLAALDDGDTNGAPQVTDQELHNML